MITTANESTKTFMFVSFIINILLAASLNKLFLLINTLQLIVLMPLYNAMIPANVSMYFNQMMEIASFEIYEIGEPLNALLGIEAQEPQN